MAWKLGVCEALLAVRYTITLTLTTVLVAAVIVEALLLLRADRLIGSLYALTVLLRLLVW